MNRRKFIQNTGLSLPFLLNGFSIRALPKSSIFSSISEETDKVLVLIQLNGGNDGLAMITPLDQYDKLANVRSNILISQSGLLNVGFENAFHPAMTGLYSVFNNGNMSVIQSVGYPNQNRSHFRSSDIWTSGSPADEVWTTGWLGRNFEKDHSSYPSGYPNENYPDPFAITLGSLVSETCQGTVSNFSLAINDPLNLNSLTGTVGSAPPNTPYGNELTYLRETIAQTNAYGEVITTAANSASNMVSYPDGNPLAIQLKNVALMIAGGLQTKVYIVSLGGFDTHANQVGDSPTVGDHATLLNNLSDAVTVFLDDLKLLGLDHRVLTMTFSEFGRRIRSNDSLGTDHGDAAPLMLFGKCVLPGFIGDNPEIPLNPDIQEAIAMQFDFRDVYGSVLMDWFGVEENDIKNLLFPNFSHIPIIGGCSTVSTSETMKEISMSISPNPFSGYFDINFTSANEHVRLSIFNAMGQELAVLVDKKIARGNHHLSYNGSHLAPGHYYVHLSGEEGRRRVKMALKGI